MADGQLRRLNFAIFVLHFSLSAIFVSIPQDLVAAGFQRDHLAWVYAPVMVGSFLCMLPLMISAEKRRRHVRVLQLGLMFVLGGVVVWLMGSQTATAVVVGLAVFFLGFNLLESLLPSLLSRIAPQALKGTALGVYSTGQFVGAFTGATSAGWLLQRQVSHGNLAIVALLLVLCLLSTIGLRGPTNG
ncbi:MAG: MFS transporter [Gammaproteobacteria bacterium]|nr:MAG: MFS transporter [Gammaproteobacteria bacterium]